MAPSMKTISSLFLLGLIHTARAHGEHGGGAKPGETVQQYAQRHMSSEHHIDSFDLRSFFHLHDLNSDGFWDKEEIEAIYGVHHIYSKKKSQDDIEHQKKADTISSAVLTLLDTDKDGKVTPEEFEAVGLDGLPNFDSLGAEGHHYDIESEFFLHHEEEFHSTPETQTDESYNHPEDIEHFSHHEHIELKEAEKEAAYEGVTVEEVLKAHEHDGEHIPPPPPESEAQVAEGEVPVVPVGGDAAQQPIGDKPPTPNPVKKIQRTTPPEKKDPSERFADAQRQSEKIKQAEWGVGDEAYNIPVSPVDKLRKNVPYKYKFKRNWGDF